MGRLKKYDSPEERHAAYRGRVTQTQQDLKHIRNVASGKELGQVAEDKKWYEVELLIEREELAAAVVSRYILEEKEMLRLQSDLMEWKRDPRRARGHSTYAFAESQERSGFPGTVTLCFEGITVKSTALLSDGFKPHPSYEISEGAVRIILGWPSA